jgi:hypothetical protein
MYRDDLPEDPDRIFLTSWGEWSASNSEPGIAQTDCVLRWPRETIEKTCNKALQDKWCPSLQEIEQEEKVI